MSSVSTRGLTHGAMMAGLTAVLMFLGTFVPVLGIVILMVVGVPITMVFIKHNINTGIISSIVATVLIGILLGPLYAVGFFIQFMIVAIAYGVMFVRRSSAGKTLAVGIITSIASILIVMLASAAVMGFDAQTQKEGYDAIVDNTLLMYEQAGLMDQLEAQGYDETDLREMIGAMTTMMISIMPATLILSSMIGAVIHYQVVAKVAKRMGLSINKLPPFSHWALPWQAVWGLIIVWGLWLLGDQFDMEILVLLSKNILLIIGVVVLVLGFAVVKFFLDRYKFSKVGWFMVILFAVMFSAGVIIMSALVGMFDLVFDFRKLKKNNE